MGALRVAVVIPTVGRLALLTRCLDALVAQTQAPDEVVVVHDGSVTDLLAGYAGTLALRSLTSPLRGAAARRNLGWRSVAADLSAGDLVAFTDDDCAPEPGWVAAIAAGPADDLLHGPVRPHPGDVHVRSAFARTLDVARPSPYYPTANLAVRTSALSRVGGFDEGLSAGEDTDLAHRVLASGGTAAWLPSAAVLHAVRPVTFPGHLRSLWRWRSLPEVVARHPALRAGLPHGVFWKPSHPLAVLALLGLALGGRVGAGLVAPLLVRDWRRRGLRFGTQDAVSEITEVAVVALGSVRAGSLLL